MQIKSRSFPHPNVAFIFLHSVFDWNEKKEEKLSKKINIFNLISEAEFLHFLIVPQVSSRSLYPCDNFKFPLTPSWQRNKILYNVTLKGSVKVIEAKSITIEILLLHLMPLSLFSSPRFSVWERVKRQQVNSRTSGVECSRRFGKYTRKWMKHCYYICIAAFPLSLTLDLNFFYSFIEASLFPTKKTLTFSSVSR